MHNLFGMQIIEAKEYPRYVLPNEIIPGVPWPDGFKEEIDKWSREFLGTVSLVPKGTMMIMHTAFGSKIIAPKDVVHMINMLA